MTPYISFLDASYTLRNILKQLFVSDAAKVFHTYWLKRYKEDTRAQMAETRRATSKLQRYGLVALEPCYGPREDDRERLEQYFAKYAAEDGLIDEHSEDWVSDKYQEISQIRTDHMIRARHFKAQWQLLQKLHEHTKVTALPIDAYTDPEMIQPTTLKLDLDFVEIFRGDFDVADSDPTRCSIKAYAKMLAQITLYTDEELTKLPANNDGTKAKHLFTRGMLWPSVLRELASVSGWMSSNREYAPMRVDNLAREFVHAIRTTKIQVVPGFNNFKASGGCFMELTPEHQAIDSYDERDTDLTRDQIFQATEEKFGIILKDRIVPPSIVNGFDLWFDDLEASCRRNPSIANTGAERRLRAIHASLNPQNDDHHHILLVAQILFLSARPPKVPTAAVLRYTASDTKGSGDNTRWLAAFVTMMLAFHHPRFKDDVRPEWGKWKDLQRRISVFNCTARLAVKAQLLKNVARAPGAGNSYNACIVIDPIKCRERIRSIVLAAEEGAHALLLEVWDEDWADIIMKRSSFRRTYPDRV